MSTFTWTPDFGASKQSKPRSTKIQFGDGYEARQASGMNPNLKTWSVSFSKRDDDEADAIEAFFDARIPEDGSHESFDWTAPTAAAASRFVCREWARVLDNNNFNTITATFEEVAEP